LLVCLLTAGTADAGYQYCIVGAGPAGLQLAQLMKAASSSYAVLERSPIAGSFFQSYPRHGKLISINKRWVDSRNTEYAMRHDWNSLLTEGSEPLLFRSYSQELFPPREAMVAYLNDYWRVNNLNVHFNTTVIDVTRSTDGNGFRVSTRHASGSEKIYKCEVIVMATGLPNLRPGEFPGHEYTVATTRDFDGKRLLIIGKGNSGFETAQHPVRFAWSTHYVGDLRAVNNELLDTYQLKSLDGLFEFDSVNIIKNARGELCLVNDDEEKLKSPDSTWDTDSRQYCYDLAVRATGFVWDSRPTAKLNVTSVFRGKYPRVGNNFESVDAPGIYFAGAGVHSLDFRQSAGGFVHGFRYTARALQRLLRVKHQGERWPAALVDRPLVGLLDALVRRINEGSGTYQMLSFLGDIVLLNRDRTAFTLLEEVPVRLLNSLPQVTGHPADGPVLVFVFEYGRNFSGPRADTFHEDRASCEIHNAHQCNFLHPVIYQYDRLPSDSADSRAKDGGKSGLPKPDRLLHLMEDFYTNFRQGQQLLPLAAFLEAAVIAQPAAALSVEHCSLRALLAGQWPQYCCQDLQKSPKSTGTNAFGGVLSCWSA
uniref:FAD/NAD(P)-binding domain-containing protein n=1 Tax=Macrostomum lignano TaxID=282301 RepID=A0A1I8GTJ6_9PLAT